MLRGARETVAATNMFCIPNEGDAKIDGFEAIDPANWTSPIRLTP